MKTILGQLCIGALLLPLFSCEDDLPVYEDVSQVYFNYVQDEDANKQTISFGYETPMRPDSTIKITVKLLGRVSDQKRDITAEVIGAESNAAEGANLVFIPDSSYIPAGKDTGKLWVKLLNTDTLLTTTMFARIRLTPNEYFHTNLNYFEIPSSGAKLQPLEYNLQFDAKSEQPNLWAALSNYFGAWSRPKELAIYAALGVDRDYFTYDPAVETASAAAAKRIKDGQIGMAYMSVINRWLKQYKEGTTYLDGTPKPADEPLRDGGIYGKSGNEIPYYTGGIGI